MYYYIQIWITQEILLCCTICKKVILMVNVYILVHKDLDSPDGAIDIEDVFWDKDQAIADRDALNKRRASYEKWEVHTRPIIGYKEPTNG